MKKKILLGISLVCVGLAFSCKRDDNEPVYPIKEISRLYVSTSDYDGSTTTKDIVNVWGIDYVDSSEFGIDGAYTTFISSAKGGSSIHFSPNGGLLFQSSVNSSVFRDTSVQVMEISKAGLITSKGVLGNRKFDRVKGLQYAVVNQNNLSANFLMFLNVSSTDTLGVDFYAVESPSTRRGFTRPKFKMDLGDKIPAGMKVVDNNLFISITGQNGGIDVYKDFLPKLLANVSTNDTVVNIINNNISYSLTVSGATNIGGISYSKAKDILLLTDYTGSGSNVIGRILVFENFSTHTSSKTISPSRIIEGTNTGLKQPLDVAIDPREKGLYFYVADPTARKVFRFNITDTGDAIPKKLTLGNDLAPQSLSLDAR